MRVSRPRPSGPGIDQSCRSGWADGVLSLPTAWTYGEGLPPKTGIPGFRDSVVPVSGRTGKDTIYSSTAWYRPESQGAARAPPVTQAGQRGQVRGRGKERCPQAGTSGVQGRVYAITPQAESADQLVIQGTFFLSCLWARVLFDSGASHSFIAASVVIELGLEVEALEEALVCEFSPRD